MRIVILSSRFPKRGKFVGGAEISALNVARGVSQRGHEVYVVTRRQQNLEKDGFKLREINFISKPTPIRYLSTAFFMVRELLKIRPDVIYCQTLLSESFAGIMAGKLLRIPVAVRAVGEIYVRTSFFERLMLKFILRNSAIVLALTNNMKKAVLKAHKCARVEIVPEGVDYDFFRKYPEKGKRHDSVLFVGSLTALKSVDTLLEAFETVEKELPKATLTLIGDGDKSEELKKLSKKLGLKRVYFMGSKTREDVAGYMKSSSLLVLPSVSEGFPLVITEAMASGLPVIATRIRGIPEIIEDGKNGYLVEPKKPEELAEKIIFLLKHKEARKKMSLNNTEKSKNYDWDVITDKLLSIFERIKNNEEGR
jgi:glycosyltransferase involved in cell wall biosynthesis